MRVHPARTIKRFAAATAVAASMVAPAAHAAAPITCNGVGAFTSIADVQIRQAGPQTFESFDYTGTHELCLADGSHVTGAIAGHLDERVAPDGDLSLHFSETLSYGGGTLRYSGEASLTGGRWEGHVQTVGEGTGALAGITGHGTFAPTGPVTFTDSIDYVYR